MENQNVIDSKFRLVILAAKRAKQLLKGSKKKLELNLENPLSVALEEIKQGKIDFEVLMQNEVPEAEINLLMVDGGDELSEVLPSQDDDETDSDVEEDAETTESEAAESEDEED